MSSFIIILIWIVFIGSTQAQPPPHRPPPMTQQELNAWDVKGLGRKLDFYSNCTLQTRCLGLPEGCIGQGNCDAFVEIQVPDAFRESVDFTDQFKFKMFLRLPDDHIQTDVDQYIAVGFNKQSQLMAGTLVIICYFAQHQNTEVNQIYHGWTPTDSRAIIPISKQVNEFIVTKLPTRNVFFERSDAGRIMKCGFDRGTITSITIDEKLYPGQAKLVNGKPLGEYDLGGESFHLLLATGPVKLDQKSGEPTFEAHLPNQKTSTAKEKIQFSECGRGRFCLGIGPDGCFHSLAEPCSLLLATEHHDFFGPEIYIVQLLSTVSIGFIGFILSSTTNFEDASFFYGCENNASRPFIFDMVGCTNSTVGDQSEVICQSTYQHQLIPGEPFVFGVPVIPHPVLITEAPVGPASNRPAKTFCGGFYRYFGALEEMFEQSYYITLFSSNDTNGTYRDGIKADGTGFLKFQIPVNNSDTHVRSKQPYFMNNTKESDFFVFPDPTTITSTHGPIRKGGFDDSGASTITKNMYHGGGFSDLMMLMMMMMTFLFALRFGI